MSREGSLEFEEDEDIIIKLTSIDPQVLLLLCKYSMISKRFRSFTAVFFEAIWKLNNA